jgi:hypothetical protein
MMRPPSTRRRESLVAPAVMVATVVMILIATPRHYHLLPKYSEIVIGGVLIASLWTRFERYAILTFAVAVAGVEITILVRLLYEMANKPSNLDAIVLLWTAIDLWLINVALFTLVYWRLDRGGPDGRAGVWQGAADFYFPRGDAGEGVSRDWQPSFVDYFYLAFTTSTAFSPSEIYPLTDRAKILHIVQSLISLLIIVALAARAINILGQ